MQEINLQFETEQELLEWTRDRNNGIAAGLVLWNFDEWLRGLVKYQDKKEWPTAEEIREHLFEVFREYDYNPDG
jgi:hypothetical protein